MGIALYCLFSYVVMFLIWYCAITRKGEMSIADLGMLIASPVVLPLFVYFGIVAWLDENGDKTIFRFKKE